MKAYELLALIEKDPEEYEGRIYEVTKGKIIHGGSWEVGKIYTKQANVVVKDGHLDVNGYIPYINHLTELVEVRVRRHVFRHSKTQS